MIGDPSSASTTISAACWHLPSVSCENCRPRWQDTTATPWLPDVPIGAPPAQAARPWSQRPSVVYPPVLSTPRQAFRERAILAAIKAGTPADQICAAVEAAMQAWSGNSLMPIEELGEDGGV